MLVVAPEEAVSLAQAVREAATARMALLTASNRCYVACLERLTEERVCRRASTSASEGNREMCP